MEHWDKTMAVSVALAIVAGIVLVAHWSPREHKVVWWAAGIGAILGVVLSLAIGDPFLLPLTYAAGTFTGAVLEGIGRVVRRIRDGY
jgi:lysylphosphatidylglycerol synthetase-like protein (DUF2156 family)